MVSERQDRASRERIARGMSEFGRRELHRGRGAAGAEPYSAGRDRWRDDRERYRSWEPGSAREALEREHQDHGERGRGMPEGGYGRHGHGRERPDERSRFLEDMSGRGGDFYGRNDSGDYGTGYRGHEDRDRGAWDRASDEVSSWFGDRDAERRREIDHRGRGPKGYRRSDERIREDVSDRLAEDPYVDASDIEVGVANGEVTLTGTVDSRQARRRAEDIAESVSGVSYVQNNIRVRQAWQSGGQLPASSGETRPASSTASPVKPATGEAARLGGLGESLAYAAQPGDRTDDRSGRS